MSNLALAAKALKKKSGKTLYRVRFEQRETFYVDVEAADKKSASKEANEIFNNGGATDEQNMNVEEIDINEI